MYKARIPLVLGLLALLVLFQSCAESDSPSGPGNGGEPPIGSETITGVLEVPPEATVEESEVEVLTFAASAEVAEDGTFSVDIPQAENYQVLIFRSEETANPIFLGLQDPVTGEVAASDSSTALALVLFNPYLLYTDAAQRQAYLQAVTQNPKFQDLLQLLRAAYQADADAALDYDANPLIYQVVAELIKETMETLGGGLLLRAQEQEAPWIEDGEGENITLVNPRHVWYAAGVHPEGGTLTDVCSVHRTETIVSFQWGWPPVVLTEPRETDYGLGDGYFMLHVARGLDFTRITQWDDPVGRATILNTGQSVLYIVELVIGHLPIPDLADLPNHFHISAQRAYQLSLDISRGDAGAFLVDFFALVADNAEEIAYWIWQEYQTDAAHEFLSTAAGIFEKVSLVLQLLAFANEQGPFFWDMIFAPTDVNYFVTQEGGVIVSMEQNEPPQAEFSVSPPAGVVGTMFTFDALGTTDDHDPLASLMFRWDWESDGTWDVGWSNDHLANHSYGTSGAYAVTLEVMDSSELTAAITHTVNVGGGAGTANHVKLFRDALPWDSDATVAVLEDLGFTLGTGPSAYEIIASSGMATAPLIPGEDLIIISNDQPQAFYDNYAASQVRFSDFVYMGGSLLWEACDEGWSMGSMDEAGVILPGNLDAVLNFCYWNYVTDPNLPLVEGLPQAMDHNYASHESFENLPDGTTIYCVDESERPTLIESNLGGGWMIASGQPLEHQHDYIYGSPDMEELLPRIISYFTGQARGEFLSRSAPRAADRSSRGER